MHILLPTTFLFFFSIFFFFQVNDLVWGENMMLIVIVYVVSSLWTRFILYTRHTLTNIFFFASINQYLFFADDAPSMSPRLPNDHVEAGTASNN